MKSLIIIVWGLGVCGVSGVNVMSHPDDMVNLCTILPAVTPSNRVDDCTKGEHLNVGVIHPFSHHAVDVYISW